MASDTDNRLKADRAFVDHLCKVTGKSASALATGAGMAATTLNRYVGRKAKPVSTIKDSTIQKIAARWGLDYLQLIGARKRIEDSIRDGRPLPEHGKAKAPRLQQLREPPVRGVEEPRRDPLMDRIMGSAYEIWFAEYRDAVAFDRLPDLVRLLYGRVKGERGLTVKEIKKRAGDMLAVAAMEKR